MPEPAIDGKLLEFGQWQRCVEQILVRITTKEISRKTELPAI
jgi:hypothetical protein